MSGATPNGSLDAAQLLGAVVGNARWAFAWLAFWLAVTLPAAYLPLLATTHLDAAAVLIAVHVVAVVLGHGHR